MLNRPKVVIGLPVYNGENFLREAIDSILAQTFTDFQLVISDNASTDGTQAICEDYVRRDSRVIYDRQSENIGGALNYNYLFERHAGDSPYFKWQAHDDTLEPTFLQRCIDQLEADPSLSIVHSRTTMINEHGDRTGTLDHEVRLNGKSAPERFWRLLWANYFSEVFGVMRSSMIYKTKLQGCFAGADRNFMAEMILQGDVGYVEDYLFARRDHPDCYCQLETTEAKQRWFGPKTSKSTAKLLGLIKTRVYLAAILALPLSLTERARCIEMLGEWMVRRGIESVTGASGQFGERVRQQSAIAP